MVYLGFLQGAAAILGLGEAGLQARYLMEPALVVAPMDPPSIVMHVLCPQEVVTDRLPVTAMAVTRALIGGHR